jgi:hypothetical protein
VPPYTKDATPPAPNNSPAFSRKEREKNGGSTDRQPIQTQTWTQAATPMAMNVMKHSEKHGQNKK